MLIVKVLKIKDYIQTDYDYWSEFQRSKRGSINHKFHSYIYLRPVKYLSL